MPYTLWEAFSLFLRDHGVFFAGLSVTLGFLSGGLALGWWRSQSRLRAAEEWLLKHAKDGDTIAPRLASLENAVDTLAVGVERLNETELFAARMLSEGQGGRG